MNDRIDALCQMPIKPEVRECCALAADARGSRGEGIMNAAVTMRASAAYFEELSEEHAMAGRQTDAVHWAAEAARLRRRLVPHLVEVA